MNRRNLIGHRQGTHGRNQGPARARLLGLSHSRQFAVFLRLTTKPLVQMRNVLRALHGKPSLTMRHADSGDNQTQMHRTQQIRNSHHIHPQPGTTCSLKPLLVRPLQETCHPRPTFFPKSGCQG